MREKFLSKSKFVLVAVAAVLALAFLLAGCSSEESKAFDAAAETVQGKNTELEGKISELQAVVDSGEKPLDESVLPKAETLVTTTRAEIYEIPEKPSNNEEVKKATDELNSVDYTAQIEALGAEKKALEESIEQYKLVTNPSEAFVVERLGGISTITEISAVTEDHDPNGKLNKQGGYTACIYFTDSQVPQEEVFGDTIIDKGNAGGGCVEVYATEEDANSRDTYLSAFDTGMLSSGSHRVVGTVVLRTSDNLTASQQNDLTQQMTACLTSL